MPVSVPACRCGFQPCAVDQDAAINALWHHIEEAHGDSVTDPRAAEIGVCLACAKNEHPRCSGTASRPCHCIHPGHDIVLTQTPDTGHVGWFVWKNNAELVWECDDDCTHPSHEEQP